MGGMWLPAGTGTRGPIGGVAYKRPPFFRTKKLGILGRTTNIAYAPFDDPSWTLASHTSARELSKREPDWYFDLHRPACFRTESKTWNPHYHTWLKRLQTPIFMQEAWPEIPMAVRYPIERVLQEYRAYFTNHVAYMIALAMMEGVKTIGLFGCQYGAFTEYSTQRGSVEYWLGRFEQAGGEVILPVKDNTLLNFPAELYGYESHDAAGKLTGGYREGLKAKQAIQAEAQGQAKVLTMRDDQELVTHRVQPPHGAPIALDRRQKLFGGVVDYAVGGVADRVAAVAGVSSGAVRHDPVPAPAAREVVR